MRPTPIAYGDLVGDWDKFLDMVHSVKNAADSIHGVPLLITKADFITLQPNKGPQAKTFFMAAFAEDTILSQDITILSSHESAYMSGWL